MIQVRGYYQYNTVEKSKLRVFKPHTNKLNQPSYFIEWADGDVAKMRRDRIMELIVSQKIKIISKAEFDNTHDEISEQEKDSLLEHVLEPAY